MSANTGQFGLALMDGILARGGVVRCVEESSVPQGQFRRSRKFTSRTAEQPSSPIRDRPTACGFFRRIVRRWWSLLGLGTQVFFFLLSDREKSRAGVVPYLLA